MTPWGVSYEDPYAEAFPFNKIMDGMITPEIIDDVIEIILEGIKRRKRMNLIINNRPGSNVPMVAQQIAKRYEKLNFKEEETEIWVIHTKLVLSN